MSELVLLSHHPRTFRLHCFVEAQNGLALRTTAMPVDHIIRLAKPLDSEILYSQGLHLSSLRLNLRSCPFGQELNLHNVQLSRYVSRQECQLITRSPTQLTP